MRYQWWVGAFTGAALSLAVPSPAFAESDAFTGAAISLAVPNPAAAESGAFLGAARSLAVPSPAFAESDAFTGAALSLAVPNAAAAETGAFLGAARSSAVPVPVFAESASRFETTKSAALKWEIGYLVLSAIDAGQTITCLERGICKEANPIFGKHPKPRTIIAAKLIGGGAHFLLFSRLNERSPKTALRVAQISAGLQGGVVLLNARFVFH